MWRNFSRSGPSRYQSLRCGEGFHEGPRARQCPVFKGLQSRWVIFAQGALELIDERGALFDQGDLVAAEQAQLGHQGIFFGQRFPAVAIEAQGIGEAPSVHMIGFVAAGNFALAIGFGARWRNRVNSDSAFQ